MLEELLTKEEGKTLEFKENTKSLQKNMCEHERLFLLRKLGHQHFHCVK